MSAGFKYRYAKGHRYKVIDHGDIVKVEGTFFRGDAIYLEYLHESGMHRVDVDANYLDTIRVVTDDEIKFVY